MKKEDHKEKVKELDVEISKLESYIRYKELQLKEEYQRLKKENPNAEFIELFPVAKKKVDYETAEKNKLELEQIKKQRSFHYLMGLEKKYMNEYLYSDVRPYEVIYEITQKYFMIRPMKCTIKKKSLKKMRESFEPGGFIGHTDNSLQEWDIEPDENASTFCVRLRKDGYWYQTGGSIKFKLSDKPVKVYDYNF